MRGKIKYQEAFHDVISLIEESRKRAYQKVNEELVLLYFNIGRMVSEKVEAGSWGDGSVNELATFINNRFPELRGFNRRGLYRMKQFYETYTSDEFVAAWMTHLNRKPDDMPEIVTTLLTQLQWSSHLHLLSKTKTASEKLFYIELAIAENLTVRELERQLNTAVYERTLLVNRNVSVTHKNIPSHLFRDPYIFEFLSLPKDHSEKDLESALVQNLKDFILEVGKGFAYMGNQYRIQVGNKDYYTDLLFFHRDLQCLVLFELKIQEFEPEFLGKLNFYLEALDRDVKRAAEKPSVGILLCKGKDHEVVEYAMARNISPAVVADYETRLIPKKVLEEKLHQLNNLIKKDL
ncbi:MAG: PDDEXK nuclease domain-containing protein [Candidatus Cyclonatronum sp.]|uniref:PDDEXK nuclease domain-containing protein n=1 Tax=Cyclonatronum sp. TaxID=3024185 RepID=UPI0025C6D0C5|nr:PDDEXK nuclease domain-containing protein [Cyclonatronum sp.]MCH8486900.1 PDDEXK nuclease domain-containing protein [Cyclonatronum sp.]